MRISNNYTYNPAYNRMAFGHSSKTVKDACGNLLYRTTTSFYRQDLSWSKLAESLGLKYKDADKINIINYGCSTGEETFTLITELLKKVKNAKKFFPVIAKDIDKENIKIANDGIFEVDSTEMLYMGYDSIKTENPYFSWHKIVDPDLELVKYNATVKYNVRGNVIFSVADMLKDIKHEPCKNTVLMCRNIWPYFTKEQQEELIKRISENFVDDSSLLVVGRYDIEQGDIHATKGGNIKELLRTYGFVEVDSQSFVYQKQTL